MDPRNCGFVRAIFRVARCTNKQGGGETKRVPQKTRTSNRNKKNKQADKLHTLYTQKAKNTTSNKQNKTHIHTLQKDGQEPPPPGPLLAQDLFLFSRVYELRQRGFDNASAVRLALEETGPLITLAGALAIRALRVLCASFWGGERAPRSFFFWLGLA